MAAVAAGLHQFAVEVDAAGIAAVAEALADVHRAVAAKQAHHLGVVAEDIAVLAVLDLRQARDGLGAGIQVAVGRAVVLGLDTAHGDLHVVLEFGTTVAEQALAGILDFGISLFFQDQHRSAAEHQGEEQHRHHGQQEDFGFQGQTHHQLLA